MCHGRLLDRAAHGVCRVRVGAQVDDRMLEHGGQCLPGNDGHVGTGLLGLAQQLQHISGRHLTDRPLANVRQDPLVQVAPCPVSVRGRPTLLRARIPFLGVLSDRVERVLFAAGLGDLPLQHWILPKLHLRLGLAHRSARVRQAHVLQAANGQQPLLGIEPIGVPPQLRSVGPDLEEQPTTIAQSIGLLCRLCAANLEVCKSHRTSSVPVRIVGQMIPTSVPTISCAFMTARAPY